MVKTNFMLCLILMVVVVIALILLYEFFDMNDFSLFKRKVTIKPPPMATPDKNKAFKIVNIYTGVTLADICELCPNHLFKVKAGEGKVVCIDTENLGKKNLDFYRTIFLKGITAKNYELELVDPEDFSLLKETRSVSREDITADTTATTAL